MKQVVQDKLGCGPNFKYHYRLDKDVYEGYALPHRLPQQVSHTHGSQASGSPQPHMPDRSHLDSSAAHLHGAPVEAGCVSGQGQLALQSRIHAHLHARGSCLRPVGVPVRDQRGLPGLPYGTSNALWLELLALACM